VKTRAFRRHAAVQRSAGLAQQSAIGGVLQESVLEKIGVVRRQALPKEQSRPDKPVKGLGELQVWQARHRRQQRVQKLPPDCRSDLGYTFCRSEPVRPRHQRRV
jgi:hypothetical protein